MCALNRFVAECPNKLHPAVADAAETCKTITDLLQQSLGLAEDSSPTSIRTKESATREQKDTLESVLVDLDDPLEPVRGHAVIVLTRALRKREASFFPRGAADFEEIYTKLLGKCFTSCECFNVPILGQMKDTDTYVFLASINAMAELAFWKTEPYLERMIDLFLDWSSQTNANGGRPIQFAKHASIRPL